MEHSHEYGCKVSISYGNADASKGANWRLEVIL